MSNINRESLSKRHIFIILALLSVVESEPQVKRRTFPLNPARSLLAATSVGSYALFGGGRSNNQPSFGSVEAVNIFDSVSLKWTTATLSQERQVLAATSVGKYALFGGGQTNYGNCSDVVDIFDSVSQKWSTAKLSQPRCFLAATSVGKYALFGGGTVWPPESDVVDIFDSTTLKWSSATLSKPRFALAATSAGQYALFSGGETHEGCSLDVVDIFDSVTQKWSTTKLSQSRYYLAATSVGKYALFGGGETRDERNNTIVSDIVDIFDSTSRTWDIDHLKIPRSALAATSIGQYALFGGGSPAEMVDIFDPSEKIWFDTELSTKRSHLAATSVGKYALFGSGYSAPDNDRIDVFEIVTPVSTAEPSNNLLWILGASAAIVASLLGIIVWMYIKQRKRSPVISDEDQLPLMDVQDSDDEVVAHKRAIALVPSDIPFEEIAVGDKLGEGSFGEIFKGKWNGQSIALKKLKSSVVSMQGFLEEAQTLISLRHKHIVLSMGMTTDPDTNQLLIVMEYMKNGSLYDLLFRNKVTLSQDEVIQLALDVAKGLNYLHCLTPKIIHRDLKSGNVLLYNKKKRAKVSDFGTARFLHASSAASTVIGTFGFIAPEVLQQLPYTEKADVYSFGALLVEMITNAQLPTIFEEENRISKIKELVGSSKLMGIIVDCCRSDPNQRPTVRHIIELLKQMKGQ